MTTIAAGLTRTRGRVCSVTAATGAAPSPAGAAVNSDTLRAIGKAGGLGLASHSAIATGAAGTAGTAVAAVAAVERQTGAVESSTTVSALATSAADAAGTTTATGPTGAAAGAITAYDRRNSPKAGVSVPTGTTVTAVAI
ncbi:hypothetical protein MSHO_39630 [Mycobacterium shottsii]|uniref:Uncharacterized protein n=1 Tax=Mycobacterium shottsii TaxID=133549 RepID=A0A7I7LFN2_9MYCO|nr:hypothetical protein MSHO_39630 [Mycobacterium shottsii]